MRKQNEKEVYRARYQKDMFEDDDPSSFDSDDSSFYERTSFTAPYPDAVYTQSDQRNNPPPRPSHHFDASSSHPRRGRNGGRRTPWLVILLLSSAVFILLLYGINVLYQPSKQFDMMVRETAQNTFAYGIYVDGVSIGGMTKDQARNTLNRHFSQTLQPLVIDVQIDQYQWRVTQNDIPFSQNLDLVLDQAYAIGRQDSTQTLSGGMTPLEYRYRHRTAAASSGAYFYTKVTYNPQDVRAFADNAASYVNKAPVDAMLASFDFSSRTFSFTNDEKGARLDTQLLYDQLISMLDQKQYTGSVVMESTPIMPSVTKVELMNSFTLLSQFSTQTTSNANRNNNIDLACRAISGTVVMPGDTFSFNRATGQRTAEKGYLPAAAIAGGTMVDEVGGGVCQVSSTLFNAVSMANMTIVSRSPHAWPSTYVDKGRDATVNWPNLDFEFRNDSAAPLFIITYYQNRTCYAEVYGASLGNGVTIQLETVVTSTTPPPSEPAYRQNPALPRGTVNVLKKPRTGYTVDTYKIFFRNGAEYKRELLCTSTYKVIQELIEFN